MKDVFPPAPSDIAEEAGDFVSKGYGSRLDKRGITDDFLARKLKSELNAKVTKVFLPKNSRKPVYSDPLVNWDTRQKARMDAHKLKGHYPAEKHQVGFDMEQVKAAIQAAVQAVVGVIQNAISDPATKQRIADALRSSAGDIPGDIPGSGGPTLPSTPA